MKVSVLITRLLEIQYLHGELDVSVMQEANLNETGIHQVESHVTDVACSPEGRIIIIGKELL
jgi:hypothetical protein